jgi:hypothetical protein
MEVGTKVLVTTTEWFFAPDGEQYRAVFGTLKGVHSDKDILGIKTNRLSADWYVQIGNLTIAGCQIKFAIETNKVSKQPPTSDTLHEGKVVTDTYSQSRIYFADEECI